MTPEPPSGRRRLAAVMCLDMTGYSALMAKDERLALSCVAALETILRAEISAAGGRLVKLMGDGSLAEFPTASAAVSCARAILKRIAFHNGSRAAPERFEVRIGLHLGDLVEQEGDIFGDAVNIAARVQPLADPGGIAMTEVVHAQVKNQASLAGLFLAAQKLKNIPEKARIFLLPPAGVSMMLWRFRRRGIPAGLSAAAALLAGGLVLGGAWTYQKGVAASTKTATAPAKPRPAPAKPIVSPPAPDKALVAATPIEASRPQPKPPQPQPKPPPTEPESPPPLEVTVEGIMPIGGEIGVAVFNQKAGYPIHIENAHEAEWVSPKEGQTAVTVAFDSLAPGEYAVSVMHDENGDRKLQRSAVGFPKEGVGFSNDQRVKMSAPKYDKAKFTIPPGESLKMTIQLDYRHRPTGGAPR